jgi:hypothetical protein
MIKGIENCADNISKSVKMNYMHGMIIRSLNIYIIQSGDIYNLYKENVCKKGVRK